MTGIRVQKYVADCGIASRRKAEELILAGKVKVNGWLATLGQKVDPSKDEVEVFGRIIKPAEDKVYIKLNKPRGYVSSCTQIGKDPNVLELVEGLPYRLFPVGRLDKESEGLIILTNDGEFANKMTHPKFGHEKEYEVELIKELKYSEITLLKNGIELDGKKTQPIKLRHLSGTRYSVILKEGINRQLRRMFASVSNRVMTLKRMRIGKIVLGDLKVGKWERVAVFLQD